MNKHAAYVRRMLAPRIKAESAARTKPARVEVQVCAIPSDLPSSRGSDVQVYFDWSNHGQLLALGLYLSREEALLLAELLTEAATR